MLRKVNDLFFTSRIRQLHRDAELIWYDTIVTCTALNRLFHAQIEIDLSNFILRRL